MPYVRYITETYCGSNVKMKRFLKGLIDLSKRRNYKLAKQIHKSSPENPSLDELDESLQRVLWKFAPRFWNNPEMSLMYGITQRCISFLE